MQARQNCIYNAKARIYIQFNGKDYSDDKSVKIGYPWNRKPGWRQALQSQKVQNLSRYVLYTKTFLLCIPDSRTCSGGVLVFPYQIENSRPVLRQYRFAGSSAFPIPQGGCILQKNYRFPGAEWMAYKEKYYRNLRNPWLFLLLMFALFAVTKQSIIFGIFALVSVIPGSIYQIQIMKIRKEAKTQEW